MAIYKLKKGEQLSSANSYFRLSYSDWLKLNSGGSIELNSIPQILKDKVEENEFKAKKVEPTPKYKGDE